MPIPNMTCLAGLLPLTALPPGWRETLLPLWVINLLATVFVSILLLRQAFRGVPGDLEDAARIDGFGFWRVYWHVMLPLVRPVLGFLALFILIAALDDAMASRDISIAAGGAGRLGGADLLMAGCLLLVPPLVATFFFASRYFRKVQSPGGTNG